MIDARAAANAGAKQKVILDRFDAALRERLRRLVTDGLIAEHKRDPNGFHSLELDYLLTYFRSAAVAGKYAILAVEPFAAYRIVALSGQRGVLPRFADDRIFASADEADHAIFLRRVQELMEPDSPRQPLGPPVQPGPIQLHGYADKICVKAGDKIAFMLSGTVVSKVRTQLVRLVHGDQHPSGPGFAETAIDSAVNGDVNIRRQFVQRGNFLRVADPDRRLAAAGAFSVHAFVFPTCPAAGQQTILGRGAPGEKTGFGLGFDAQGCLNLWVGDGIRIETVRLATPAIPHLWHFVVATFDSASGAATIRQEPVVNRYNSRLSPALPIAASAQVHALLRTRPKHDGATDFLIGGTNVRDPDGAMRVGECFNGKIDRCGMQDRALTTDELAALGTAALPPGPGILAYWDTSRGYSDRGIDDVVVDVGPFSLHARGFNRPVRGQTGWNWAGKADSFRLAPEEYGGIEFHDDALTDCRWQPTLELTVPPDLKSGAYALKLVAGTGSTAVARHVVFFVRPAKPRASLCLLIPTASYLAYTNGPRSLEADVAQVIMARTPVLTEFDIEACAQNYEFGLSTYDLHRDGAGVCYSSYRRPCYTMQPTYRLPGVAAPWQFPADLSLIAWLDHAGYDYDLITDEDLDREGTAALSPYRVVLNGTHCEYYSERMMDATEDYLAGGGRLMYLAGNGYYWVVGFRRDEPWVLEVRRCEGASRAWEGRPGESYLASTGEPGGLWRHRNRAPQKLVGTGFATEGMDMSTAFRRLPESYDQSISWIFAGVGGERFGDSGLVHGGAAGLEIDRYDPALGSAPNAYLLASSEALSHHWQLAQEEVMFPHPALGADQNPMARGDIVYFATRKGGAVFSASSMTWAASLPVNGFHNDVARITRNVMDAFLRDGPLPASGSQAEASHVRG